MERFLNICGFFFAHAVWSISDGSVLIAFGVTGDSATSITQTRFVNEEAYEKSVENAKTFLAEESTKHPLTAIYFDGYYTYPEGVKTDALYMIARQSSEKEITVILPYNKKEFLSPLKIFKPKLVNIIGINQEELVNKFETFWEGIAKHEKGAAVWNKAIDQSK